MHVDLLVVQLAHDGLNSHTLHANAGAHRIDARVVGLHGDFGTTSWYAGDAANLNNALGDLRHFHLEKATDEIGIGA